jgi:hypothetical protein
MPLLAIGNIPNISYDFSPTLTPLENIVTFDVKKMLISADRQIVMPLELTPIW